ncbi:MAG: hypothetical protein HFJ34_01855 [Clostridia bacterium]|nr:hypothetical protein [Clostridia bacterium]
MKKLAIFFLVIIIIIVGISYVYLNYKSNYYTAKRENEQFQSYAEQEIYGTELTSIINKAVDNNKKNEVQKDEKGKYINNDNNSIHIEIKMLDNDKIYTMETLYGGGMDKFVQYYSDIKFKCIKIEYHKSTNRIKYMLFEQITQ